MSETYYAFNIIMKEPSCIHAKPQFADCLDGVCVFCYRNRLALARKDLKEISDAAAKYRKNPIKTFNSSISKTKVENLLRAIE